ncbi:MAG TPA: DUF4129 domain-containing protein [Mycobacteriales bacterium]|nr:DUF4129 domain-containing protein [Mycobacteriales bacterium]
MRPAVRPGAAPPGPVTREGAHDAAVRELSKPQYHRDDPSAVQRIAHWIDHTLSRLLGDVLSAAPGGGLGLVIILVVLVAVIVLIRVRLGAVPVRDLFTDRDRGARARTADDYRAEADRFAADGAWAEAVRARTRAVVRALEERGVIEAPPGKTLTGLSRELDENAPALAADAGRVATLFADVWYGDHEATAATDAEIRAADERLAATRAVTR